jgi:hypothetical protein
MQLGIIVFLVSTAVSKKHLNNFKLNNKRNTMTYTIKPITNDFTGCDIRELYAVSMSYEPTKYYLTITYPDGTPYSGAEESIKAFFHFLNQKVYFKRYTSVSDCFIQGFVIRERAGNGTLHYHSLISDKDNRIPDLVSFKILIDIYLKKPRTSDTSDMLLTAVEDWELQECSDGGDDDLVCHVLWCIDESNMTAQEVHDSVGVLGKGCIEFGSLSLF